MKFNKTKAQKKGPTSPTLKNTS